MLEKLGCDITNIVFGSHGKQRWHLDLLECRRHWIFKNLHASHRSLHLDLLIFLISYVAAMGLWLPLSVRTPVVRMPVVRPSPSVQQPPACPASVCLAAFVFVAAVRRRQSAAFPCISTYSVADFPVWPFRQVRIMFNELAISLPS